MALHRSHPPERREFTVWGRYLDRYQRRDGEWKFLRRRLVFDHGSIIAVDEDGFAAMGGDAPNGRADRTDPSWELRLLAELGT